MHYSSHGCFYLTHSVYCFMYIVYIILDTGTNIASYRVPQDIEQSFSYTPRTTPTAVHNIATLSPKKMHRRQILLSAHVNTYLIKTL